MKTLTIVLLAMSVLAGGCVRTQRFRYVQQQRECFVDDKDPLPGKTGENRQWPSLECLHATYSIGFIEFDEQGKSIDPDQATKALLLMDEARRQRADGKIVTLVYVHGWKNNASESRAGGKPKDVEKFKSALTELGYRSRTAAALRDDPQPIPIVGIYMAWRGKSLMGPSWFTFVSLWSRRNTANRIGDGDDFAPTLKRVIDNVNDGSGSRVVLVGHSFGARVLEHGIETHQIELYRKAAVGEPKDPLVDLTLYVNSANDTRLGLSRIQTLRTAPVTIRHPDYDEQVCRMPDPKDAERCRDYPLLVAVSSTGDAPTKLLLPVADTINLDKLHPSSPKPVKPVGGPYLDNPPAFWLLQRSATAQTTFLQSHVVHEVACPAIPDPIDPQQPVSQEERLQRQIHKEVLQQRVSAEPDLVKKSVLQAEFDALVATEVRDELSRQAALNQALKARAEAIYHPRCPESDANCRFVFRSQDADPVCYQGDVRVPVTENGNTRAPYNQTAFWAMSVDPRVIKDHGDIWNLSFVEMLSQLMAPRGFFEPGRGSGRVRVLQAAAASR